MIRNLFTNDLHKMLVMIYVRNDFSDQQTTTPRLLLAVGEYVMVKAVE